MQEVKSEPLGKKHDWTEFSGSLGFLFKLIVKEEQTDRVIDKFFWNTKKEFGKVLGLLRLKYGLEYLKKND